MSRRTPPELVPARLWLTYRGLKVGFAALVAGLFLALVLGLLVSAAFSATPRHHHAPLTATHAATFRVTAWNEKSFPRMSRAKYRHDLKGTTSGWVKAPALAYLGSEWNAETGEQGMMRKYAANHGWTYRGVHDAGMVLRQPKRLHIGGTISRVFHRAVARHSPARWYVKTWGRIDGYPVLFVATHLTQGCAGPRVHAPVRCRANAEERSWLREHVIAPAHRNHRTVIIGGDMNRNPLIRWGARQAAIRPRTLMQIAVVPAVNVRASVSHTHVVSRLNAHGLWTDHLTPSARVRLARR